MVGSGEASVLRRVTDRCRPSEPDHGEHLLFSGRIHPGKGTAQAIAVAQRTRRRLDIAGIVQDGTPVIAHDRGSMGELIRHGVDGCLTADIDGAVAAVELVGSLDRAQIRASARQRFDRATMVQRYASVYEDLLRH